MIGQPQFCIIYIMVNLIIADLNDFFDFLKMVEYLFIYCQGLVYY